MILTAHQPSYLPWLGLFNKIALADKFCFFESVQYQPRSFDNRNKINTKAGPIWLTVPVFSSGHRDKSCQDIQINNESDWRLKHWRSIEVNYKKTPFFDQYALKLHEFYKREWQYLVELNYEMLLLFLELLGIGTQVVRMKNYEFQGKKNDLVLDMCKQLNADVYIFGGEGINYCDQESFAKAKIKLHFQKYVHPEYKQAIGHKKFEANLSVIDLLFNQGPESLSILRSGNLTREEMTLSLEGK